MYGTHEFTRVTIYSLQAQSSASYAWVGSAASFSMCHDALLVPCRSPLSVLDPVGEVHVDFDGLSGGSPTARKASAT